VEINPGDAARLGIAAGMMVRIASRRGSAEAVAFVTESVQAGQVFLPMHYEVVNQLTQPAFDPYSRQPSYKATAVSVAPVGE
jgi:ferredoxin-nitrate reductase